MHVGRIAVLERLWDEQEKQEKQEWLLGHWVSARAQHHASVADKEIPQTKSEQKANEKKNHNAAIRKAQRWREEHDPEWFEAISDPRHFGAFIGFPHIMGEPPQKRVQTPEEIKTEREEKIKRGHDAAYRAMKGIFGGC